MLAQPLCAHDHWVAPSSFAPATNERVDLFLRVGHPSEFEEQLRDPRHTVRFTSLGPDGRVQPVLGLDGKSPAGLFRAKAPGTYLLAFQSDPSFVELTPEKYAEYLRTEGLEEIQAERERANETALSGRDSFARFDKTLVRVGGGAPQGFDRAVGLPYELVLETDPSSWKAGNELVLRLEFEGQPLAGRQIKLSRLTAPYLVVLARTDEHGRARFVPESAGPWCAFTVHQRRATPEQKLEGDWECFWASFSFELGGSAGAQAQ